MQDTMQGVTIPYIPASLWILAAALTMAVLIVMFLYQLHWRRRQAAFIKDGNDVASLAAEKAIKQADVDALRNWISDQKNELQSLASEREQQEQIRAELTTLEQKCVTQDMNNEELRREVGDLENNRYLLSQTLDRLRAEIGDLEKRRNDAEALERRIEELQSRVEETKAILTKTADAEIRIDALNREKLSLENAIPMIKAEAEIAQIGRAHV